LWLQTWQSAASFLLAQCLRRDVDAEHPAPDIGGVQARPASDVRYDAIFFERDVHYRIRPVRDAAGLFAVLPLPSVSPAPMPAALLPEPATIIEMHSVIRGACCPFSGLHAVTQIDDIIVNS